MLQTQASNKTQKRKGKIMKNLKNAFVWVAIGITAFVLLSHYGLLTLYLDVTYMVASMVLYTTGVLVALLASCKIGAILYAAGVATDILGPVIGGWYSDSFAVNLGYGIGGSIVPIIGLVMLLLGIKLQNSMNRKAKAQLPG